MSWKYKNLILKTLDAEKNLPQSSEGIISAVAAWPNSYEFGMGNLGYLNLYQTIAAHGSYHAERVFLPPAKHLNEIISTGVPLFSWESRLPLQQADIILFSVSYELDYINLVKMLSAAGIPPLRSDREQSYPLIAVGGFAPSLNPAPLAEISDLIFIGDSEGMLAPFLDLFADLIDKRRDRNEIIKESGAINGVYAPGHSETVSRNRAPAGFEPVSSAIIAPGAQFGEMVLIEAVRGCGRLCDFCAAGFASPPPRYQPTDKILSRVIPARTTGLVGAGIADHPEIYEICHGINNLGGDFSLSSFRVDRMDDRLIKLLAESGQKTITIAPETGSEKLRRTINKPIADNEIIDTAARLFAAGVETIKAYFLFGLPEETIDDLHAISDLFRRMQDVAGRGNVIISAAAFSPKPFTPFGETPFAGLKELGEKIRLLKKEIPRRYLRLGSSKDAFLQTYLGRAGAEAATEIISIAEGARPDFSRLAADSALLGFAAKDNPPWSIVSGGVARNKLAELARAAKSNHRCRTEDGSAGSDCKLCINCAIK